MRRAAGAAVALVATVTLAACGSSTPEPTLPDLAELGLEAVGCEETQQLAGIAVEDTEAVAECWTGAPADGFVATADAVLAALLAANDGAEDITGALCWDDTVTEAEASACRGMLLGDTETGALAFTVVALVDPAAVLGDLPDEPSEAQVQEAIADAELEVLVFSEPAAAEIVG